MTKIYGTGYFNRVTLINRQKKLAINVKEN